MKEKAKIAEGRQSDEFYMGLALEEARLAKEAGEVPVGAVIADGEGRVVAAARNKREELHDATAHAELIAVQEACAALGRWRLSDCSLYVTLEPCPMCSGAVVNARVGRLVYGCPDSKAGGAESIFNIVNNAALNHRTAVRAGVLEEECRAVLKDFFKERRPQKD